MSNPNCADNLIPCEKGHTNNPNGRPKGKSLTTILRKVFESKMPIKENPLTLEAIDSGQMTVREVFIMSQIAQAMKGNSPISKEIWERLEGKTEQPIKQTIVNDKPDLSKLTDEELKTMVKIESKIIK